MLHRPILAIVGGSASGKSTLTHTLKEVLSIPASILPLDRYYHDLSHLPYSERENTNFDHPDAIDTAFYIEHLQSLSNHKSISAPRYDFVTHTRAGYEKIQSNSLILTEGILLLAIPEIRECIDFSIYLEVPEEVRLQRKIDRDITERSRTERYAKDQFMTTVKPIHDKMVTPSKQYAHLILDGTQSIHHLCLIIQPHITNLLTDSIK